MVPGILPRVVVIWVVQVDGALYVVCNSAAAGWSASEMARRLKCLMQHLLNARLVTQDLRAAPGIISIELTAGGGFALAEAGDRLACFAWSLARPVRCQPRCPCAAAQTAGSYAVR